MKAKLTLYMDKKLIRSAKDHAEITVKSVSQLIADYFYLVDKGSTKEAKQLTPIVQRLKGSLKNAGIDAAD